MVTIVAKKGRTIVFTPPLRYFHYGGQEYQAEVGVLDRRITIQGNFADSEAGILSIYIFSNKFRNAHVFFDR